MQLKHYVASLTPDDREQFATNCETTLGHMRNVMYGYRPCSAELAAAIERVSSGTVKRQTLRPDDWQKVWPELAQAPAESAHAATEIAAQGVA